MNIQNKKIIWCHKSDLCLSWVHNLTQNKTIYEESDTYEVYYSNAYDVFFFYFKGEDNNHETILKNISLLKDLQNYVHVILYILQKKFNFTYDRSSTCMTCIFCTITTFFTITMPTRIYAIFNFICITY